MYSRLVLFLKTACSGSQTLLPGARHVERNNVSGTEQAQRPTYNHQHGDSRRSEELQQPSWKHKEESWGKLWHPRAAVPWELQSLPGGQAVLSAVPVGGCSNSCGHFFFFFFWFNGSASKRKHGQIKQITFKQRTKPFHVPTFPFRLSKHYAGCGGAFEVPELAQAEDLILRKGQWLY